MALLQTGIPYKNLSSTRLTVITALPSLSSLLTNRMENHASYMLDAMIAAVDAGFSHDGIAPIPETGLKDVEHRSCLAGSLCDRVVSSLSNLLIAGPWDLGYRIGFG